MALLMRTMYQLSILFAKLIEFEEVVKRDNW